MTRSGGVPDDTWTAVDDHIGDLFVGEDDALRAALDASTDAGLPAISVSSAYGKMLHLLARAIGAKRILEIGTLGGYSAIWLARALPSDGRLVTLELEQKHADVARANLDRAGVGNVVEVRVGPAVDSLRALAQEKVTAFDMVFIDADKPSYPDYLDLSLAVSRAGTLIVADNVVRRGAILDPDSKDANVRGIRAFHEKLRSEKRVSATVVQTVGTKGYDGFALAVVTG